MTLHNPTSGEKELFTAIDWLQISDLPAILTLDSQVYQENTIGNLDTYTSWERKNPKLSLIAFESSNRANVLAYASLLPLPEDVIASILRGEREDFSLSATEIETYERKGGYTLLVESVVTHPDHPTQLHHIVKALFDFWCEQYPDRYIIKLYAQAATTAGEVLIRKLCFSALPHLSPNAYMLDLERPGKSKLMQSFQQALKNK